MWEFLKKSATMLWRSVRNNRLVFSLASLSIACIVLPPLAGLLLLAAAIPLAIVIGLLSTMLLGYGLVLVNFYLVKGRPILTSYADKLTSSQKKLYVEFIEIDKAAKTALKPYLLPALQDIVFSYFTIHRMTLTPRRFQAIIGAIDINDTQNNNGIIMTDWFYQGSLGEFIQFVSWVQQVGVENSIVQEKTELLLDLLALAFNKPDLLAKPICPEGTLSRHVAETPNMAVIHCMQDAIRFERTELLHFLLQYSKTNLPEETGDFLEYAFIILLKGYNQGTVNLDLILDTLVAEKFSPALYENALEATARSKSAVDPVYQQTVNNFFTRVTTKLKLPAMQPAIEATPAP